MESENSDEEYKSRPDKRSRGGGHYNFKGTMLTKDEYNIATGKSVSYRNNNHH